MTKNGDGDYYDVHDDDAMMVTLKRNATCCPVYLLRQSGDDVKVLAYGNFHGCYHQIGAAALRENPKNRNISLPPCPTLSFPKNNYERENGFSASLNDYHGCYVLNDDCVDDDDDDDDGDYYYCGCD